MLLAPPHAYILKLYGSLRSEVKMDFNKLKYSWRCNLARNVPVPHNARLSRYVRSGEGGTAPEIVEKFAELFRLVRLVRNSPFSGIKRHTELDY